MEIKLFDSERRIMDLLWREGDCTAKRLAELLSAQVGWSKTTTYTVLKKCIDKGAVERKDPGFLCHPLISLEQARAFETDELISKLYDGAADQLVASILGRGGLSRAELDHLRRLIDTLE